MERHLFFSENTNMKLLFTYDTYSAHYQSKRFWNGRIFWIFVVEKMSTKLPKVTKKFFWTQNMLLWMFFHSPNKTCTHIWSVATFGKLKTRVTENFFFNFWKKIKKNRAKSSLVGRFLNLMTGLSGTIIVFLLVVKWWLGYVKASISSIKK